MGPTVTGMGPVREHGPRDCCLVCRSPLSEVSTVTWDAILVTVDGFGFGTLTGESCLKNVHCHTDRASWDAILVTVVAFGALMWKKCAQSHSFGLGRVGGGGDTIGAGGGGSANREPGSYIYIYIYIHVYTRIRVCIYIYTYTYVLYIYI